MRQTDRQRIIEICARLVLGERVRPIGKATGASKFVIVGIQKELVSFGITLNPAEWRKPRTEGRAEAEQLFLETEMPVGDIAKQVGCSQTLANQWWLSLTERLVREGRTIPSCSCGKLLRHHGGCSTRVRPRRVDWVKLKALLLKGYTHTRIGTLVHASLTTIARYAKQLSSPERALRERNKYALQYEVWDSARPFGDPTYRRAHEALPRQMDETVREDTIQDACIAFYEGNLTEENFDAGLKKILASNYAWSRDKRATISLDEKIYSDGPTRLERLEDPSALEAFELIGHEEEWD